MRRNFTHPLQIRLASRYMEQQRIIMAKNKFLKAIDFAFGILNRMKMAGYQFRDASLDEIRKRLTVLRKAVQVGGGQFHLDKLEDLVGTLSRQSERVLHKMLLDEARLIPDIKDWAAFLMEFPDKSKQATTMQSKHLAGILLQKTGKTEQEIYPTLMADASFAAEAYKILMPDFQKAYGELTGALSGFGKMQARIKEFPSAYKKASGRGIAFIDLGDLVGCRSVAPDVRQMAEACTALQGRLTVMSKDNKYLDNRAYLAVHYDLMATNNVMVELQVKSSDNLIEAAISHDILHKPELSLISLTKAERDLVQMVVDISIQASIKDMARYMEMIS